MSRSRDSRWAVTEGRTPPDPRGRERERQRETESALYLGGRTSSAPVAVERQLLAGHLISGGKTHPNEATLPNDARAISFVYAYLPVGTCACTCGHVWGAPCAPTGPVQRAN